ncbi:MAG TPA: GNAT family N-acetyltransferase [Steroidobacteraceae bacterium]|jgi:GNAT superfamily N-acetyltransferase|nr:GNAT family N-acetyltransferase [Steroidobacteraceae bacterium]
MSEAITIRPADEGDVGVILQFIRDLAKYEHLEHEVVATEGMLREALFGGRPYAEVVLACLNGEPVGFALFFHNFSTFLGRAGIYLEDLYVRPEARGHGVGRCLLTWLAATAVSRGCGRLEWAVLDWNEPSIRFYRNLGAVALDDWTTYRVTGPALSQLAGAS